MKNNFILGFAVGALITAISMIISGTILYGRMANHKKCDMNVDNLNALEKSAHAKYHNYSNQ